MTKRPPRRKHYHKTSYAVDPRVATMLKKIARAEGTSASGALALFVAEGVKRYVGGELDFDGVLEASRAPIYDWVVRPSGLDQLADDLGRFLDDNGGRVGDFIHCETGQKEG